jgi:hypothetical protein
LYITFGRELPYGKTGQVIPLTARRACAFNRQPTALVYNLDMVSSFLNEPADSAGANQVLCADLSLLFTLFNTRLLEAIARTGGRPLADQFTQQLNLHAQQHGWSVLTGLSDLNELRRRIPDVDAKVLASVYLGYAQHAQKLARQILGGPLLKSTLAAMLANLPPDLAQLNTQYGIIRLT